MVEPLLMDTILLLKKEVDINPSFYRDPYTFVVILEKNNIPITGPYKVLLDAVEEKIPSDMMQIKKAKMNIENYQDKYIERLKKNRYLVHIAAKWAVDTWATILGLKDIDYNKMTLVYDSNRDDDFDKIDALDPNILVFKGKGQRATTKFKLKKGLALVYVRVSSDNSIRIDLYDESGDRHFILWEQNHKYYSTVYTIDKTGTYLLDVSFDGSWEIKIQAPN